MSHPFTNITGDIHYEERNGSGGEYRSQLERDECLYWLMEPGVTRVVIEPETIQFLHGEKQRRYTPDLLVEFPPADPRQSFYVECKYRDAVDAEMEEFHERLREEFAARGRVWKRRTEEETYDPTFKVRRFLLLARDELPDTALAGQILSEVRSQDGIRLGDLLQRLSSDRRRQLEIVPQVWRLAGHHALSFPWDTVPCEDTVLRVGQPMP